MPNFTLKFQAIVEIDIDACFKTLFGIFSQHHHKNFKLVVILLIITVE